MKGFYRIFFSLLFSIIVTTLLFIIFNSVLYSKSIILDYGFITLDLYKRLPLLFKNIHIIFFISSIISNFFVGFSISSHLFNNINKPKINKDIPSGLNLYIGTDSMGNNIFLPEKALFQNMLITGTIGSGKTSGAMFPFVKQFIRHKTDDNQKIGMLILDVKGNFYKQIKQFCEIYNRQDDLIVLELNGEYKYNPLDKQNLKPSVIANRLKTILTLFSNNNPDSYWLDKLEQAISEAIKLCRIYNNRVCRFY